MKADTDQLGLFTPPAPDLPEGLRYQPDLISPEEEAALLTELAALPFQPFDFGGYLANRQVVSFGLRYDYGTHKVVEVAPLPTFLAPLRARIAAFAGHPPEAFVQVLINEYRVGAGVGWHRDRPQFGDVVGVSLLSPCPFRFRLKDGERWLRRTVEVEPRSAYLMTGPARTTWEHSIAPVEAHRYSITFRTLSEKGRRSL